MTASGKLGEAWGCLMVTVAVVIVLMAVSLGALLFFFVRAFG